jgi:hypothetical protein
MISGATLAGVVGNDDVTLGNDTTGTFAQTTVGTDIDITTGMTISGADAGNYTLTQPAGLTADITPKELTVTGTAAADKVYDGNTAAVLSGATLIGVVGGDEVVLGNDTAGTFAQDAVGTGIGVSTGMTISGADSGNYTLTQPAGITADITAKELIVCATCMDKVYDDTTTATVILSDNRIPGDDLTLDCTAANFEDKNIGVDKIVYVTGITVTGPDAGNYTYNETATTTADITSGIPDQDDQGEDGQGEDYNRIEDEIDRITTVTDSDLGQAARSELGVGVMSITPGVGAMTVMFWDAADMINIPSNDLGVRIERVFRQGRFVFIIVGLK